jgi:hypothetical protein
MTFDEVPGAVEEGCRIVRSQTCVRVREVPRLRRSRVRRLDVPALPGWDIKDRDSERHRRGTICVIPSEPRLAHEPFLFTAERTTLRALRNAIDAL